MKRCVLFIAVTCAAGCGVDFKPATTAPPGIAELAPLETSPETVLPAPPTAQASIPFVLADPAEFVSPFSDSFAIESGSVDVLGALLDALLVELLAPVGPRLNDSMTFLERLCLEGDNTDTFCRQRFSR